jgi:hypothetical protein
MDGKQGPFSWLGWFLTFCLRFLQVLQAVAALLRMSGRTLARVMADMYAGRMQQSLLINKGVYGSKEIRSNDDSETNVLPKDMISSREIFEESVEQQLLEFLQA